MFLPVSRSTKNTKYLNTLLVEGLDKASRPTVLFTSLVDKAKTVQQISTGALVVSKYINVLSDDKDVGFRDLLDANTPSPIANVLEDFDILDTKWIQI